MIQLVFFHKCAGAPFWAQRHMYSGGGYVANLGNEASAAFELLRDLVDNNWIERYSRALMIEFNVWNANTNLFNYVLICVEFVSEGSFLHSVNIDAIVLYRYCFVYWASMKTFNKRFYYLILIHMNSTIWLKNNAQILCFILCMIMSLFNQTKSTREMKVSKSNGVWGIL